MKQIKNIAFDLGGVVIALSYEQAVRRFEEIGLKDARQHLDAFHQRGIFGDLERGIITTEEFRIELGKLIGREVTYDECLYAWHGYVEYVPQKNLQMLLKLRQLGYKVCLLSNTNPFMMQWAMSNEFDGNGHSMDYYFDNLYLSYKYKYMKPSPEIFKIMLEGQQSRAKTLFPENNEDWTEPLAKLLGIE